MTLRIVLGVAIGAAVGLALGYFGKCTSGVCPLTRNPYISTVLWALIGFLIASSK